MKNKYHTLIYSAIAGFDQHINSISLPVQQWISEEALMEYFLAEIKPELKDHQLQIHLIIETKKPPNLLEFEYEKMFKPERPLVTT